MVKYSKNKVLKFEFVNSNLLGFRIAFSDIKTRKAKLYSVVLIECVSISYDYNQPGIKFNKCLDT